MIGCYNFNIQSNAMYMCRCCSMLIHYQWKDCDLIKLVYTCVNIAKITNYKLVHKHNMKQKLITDPLFVNLSIAAFDVDHFVYVLLTIFRWNSLPVFRSVSRYNTDIEWHWSIGSTQNAFHCWYFRFRQKFESLYHRCYEQEQFHPRQGLS